MPKWLRGLEPRHVIGTVEDLWMFGRWIAAALGLVGVSIFVLKGGLPSSGQPTPDTTLLSDPTPVISQSGEAMRSLQSLKLSLAGTMVVGGDSVQITGAGSLAYPNQETMSYQLRVPAKVPGLDDTVVGMEEKVEHGHRYVRYQGQAWKDVTNGQTGQIAPGLDPMGNLEFARAFRAADDLGDLVMDGVYVHHYSLNVDPAKYVSQLQADSSTALSPPDAADMSTAGIQVEVWIGAKDHYMHQLKIQMVTRTFTFDITYRYSDFVAGGGPTSV
jgi:hypothetical protein